MGLDLDDEDFLSKVVMAVSASFLVTRNSVRGGGGDVRLRLDEVVVVLEGRRDAKRSESRV